jgi:hypothetical protein
LSFVFTHATLSSCVLHTATPIICLLFIFYAVGQYFPIYISRFASGKFRVVSFCLLSVATCQLFFYVGRYVCLQYMMCQPQRLHSLNLWMLCALHIYAHMSPTLLACVVSTRIQDSCISRLQRHGLTQFICWSSVSARGFTCLVSELTKAVIQVMTVPISSTFSGWPRTGSCVTTK